MRERSEGESGSELAGVGTWDNGAARVDEAERLEEAGGVIGDVDVVVGAVVGAVGHVERLVEEGDVVAFVDRDGVGDTGVQLEERQAVVGVVGDLPAGPGAKAVLVIRGGGGVPCGVGLGGCSGGAV